MHEVEKQHENQMERKRLRTIQTEISFKANKHNEFLLYQNNIRKKISNIKKRIRQGLNQVWACSNKSVAVSVINDINSSGFSHFSGMLSRPYKAPIMLPVMEPVESLSPE